jgi:prepilin-type N-terminal cleavage/methylation domain-containing protein
MSAQLPHTLSARVKLRAGCADVQGMPIHNGPWSARTRPSAGFTMIELMVVVVIVGILIAIAVPRFTTARHSADAKQLTAAANSYRTAVDAYRLDNGNESPSLGGPEWTNAADGPINVVMNKKYLVGGPPEGFGQGGKFTIGTAVPGGDGGLRYVRSGTTGYQIVVYRKNGSQLVLQCAVGNVSSANPRC